MITMEPVLRHGMSGWDQTLIPADEYDVRVTALIGMLDRHQAQAAVIASDPFDPGTISYLNGYVPTTKWALLLIAVDGRQLLVAGLGGGRDHPHIRAVSAARDIAFFRRPATGLADTLRAWQIAPGRLATVGFDRHLPGAEADDIEQAHRQAGWDIVALDDAYAEARRVKRPRELRLMAIGRARLVEAVAAGKRSLLDTGDSRQALAAVERRARESGAHDLRIMADDGDGHFQPYRGDRPGAGGGSWYVAAEYLGYWSEVAVALAPSGRDRSPELGRRLEAIGADLQPNAVPAEVTDRHSPNDGTAGVELRRIGSSLDERGGPDRLLEGEVVAVLVWSRDGRSPAVTGQQYVVGPAGGRPLAEVVA